MKGNGHNSGNAALHQKQAWLRERQPVSAPVAVGPDGTPVFAQKHYSPAEVAAMWGISVDSARRMFMSEPGVLVIGDEGGGRHYRTLRIPESVVQRVHRRLSNSGGPRC